MIVYNLDENLECRCGHKWEDHHHGCIMNKEYSDYPLNINGCIAEECEYSQVNGKYFKDKEVTGPCMCNNFKPQAHSVQKLVDEWNKKHDEMRRKKNG